MKNFDNMKKSPLIGIRFYENGERLDLGGETGGIATKKWNKEENKKHRTVQELLPRVKNFHWHSIYNMRTLDPKDSAAGRL